MQCPERCGTLSKCLVHPGLNLGCVGEATPSDQMPRGFPHRSGPATRRDARMLEGSLWRACEVDSRSGQARADRRPWGNTDGHGAYLYRYGG